MYRFATTLIAGSVAAVLGSSVAQALFCRRRHQPRRPPLAKIRPGRPAPAMGPGTADAGVIVKTPSPEQSFRASGTAIFDALATKLAEHPPEHPPDHPRCACHLFRLGFWLAGRRAVFCARLGHQRLP